MVHFYINKQFSPVYLSPNRVFKGNRVLTTSILTLKKWIFFYFWAKNFTWTSQTIFNFDLTMAKFFQKSAKNAAKKFQIEDDFYCQNTAGPKKTFLTGNLFMTARVTAFEFKINLCSKCHIGCKSSRLFTNYHDTDQVCIFTRTDK